MPSAQGKYPGIAFTPGAGTMCGVDDNGSPTTTNSYNYRGRPYTFANMVDQSAFDFNREHAKVSWQKGLRIVALYMTTSQNPIQ